MDAFPPSPHDGFLQIRIPDLGDIGPDNSVARFEANRVEKEVLARANDASPNWLCEAAELHRDRGRLTLALDFADRAISAAKQAGSDLQLVKAYVERSSIRRIQGNFDSARADLDAIRSLTIGEGRQKEAALYEENLATILLRTMGGSVYEFEESGERFTRAASLYHGLGDIPGQIRIHIGLASIRSGRGLYFAAVEEAELGIRLSVKSEYWKYMGQLLGCAAFAFRDQGYRQRIDELFELSIDWSTYVGDLPQRVQSLGGQGVFHRFILEPTDQKEYDLTVALLCQAIREAQEIGAGPQVLGNQIDLARTYEKVGNHDAYRRALHLAEQATENEAFEGAHRLFDWNEFIEGRLNSAREERYAVLLEEAIEGSADPFFVFDPPKGSDGKQFDLLNEFRNSAANLMLGIDKTVIRVLGDMANIPPFVGLVEPMRRAALERESFADEIMITTDSGVSIWFARRVVPAGEGAVVTFRDVTTHHRIEEALRDAAERAREADQAKSEFLANMSHEVRTPINGVLGLARLLRELDLEPKAQIYVDGIISSGTILLKVIGDVLDLSKIEARKMRVNAGPVNLSALVGEVAGLFSGQATESGVTLTTWIDPALPATVLADGTYLRQVLANLVANAIKFTKEGSIRVSAKRSAEMVEVEVVDTGIGIPADRIKDIFEPFQQAIDESDWGGTGLGLTISRRLIELMGGSIGVESHSGEGSRFYFVLPLIEVTDSAIGSSLVHVEESIRFDGKRVLIVDDNVVNTLVAEGMASRLGCVVTVAENGQKAVELVEAEVFDAVLMDMRMPVMDGLEATTRIRAAEQLKGGHLPIIALTAGALTQERDACLAAGMDDYLVKPFTLSSLREALFKALD